MSYELRASILFNRGIIFFILYLLVPQTKFSIFLNSSIITRRGKMYKAFLSSCLEKLMIPHFRYCFITLWSRLRRRFAILMFLMLPTGKPDAPGSMYISSRTTVVFLYRSTMHFGRIPPCPSHSPVAQIPRTVGVRRRKPKDEFPSPITSIFHTNRRSATPSNL
jgi:hypothetical protein